MYGITPRSAAPLCQINARPVQPAEWITNRVLTFKARGGGFALAIARIGRAGLRLASALQYRIELYRRGTLTRRYSHQPDGR